MDVAASRPQPTFPPFDRTDGAPRPLDQFDSDRFRTATAVVILPTLNEEVGLARTLEGLPMARFNDPDQRIQPLIIDGGSSDRTLEVAREWGIPVLQQTSRGKGGAMLEAIAWVHQRGIPYVVVLDADATYPGDRVLPALDLLRGGTDLVIGVRRPTWGPPTDFKDLAHRVGNLALSYSASLLSRRTILDLCSGFWAVSTDRFMELGLDDSSFAIEAELILKSVRRGYAIHQIPVDYRERVGVAKLRALRDGSRILRTVLREARRYRRPAGMGRPSARWGRDVLSIGLSLGTSGALLECSPSEAGEAGRIARYLRPNLPETHVRVGGPTSGARAGAPAILPIQHPEAPDLGASRTRLTISLPGAGSTEGTTSSATVTFRSHQGQRRIELSSTSVDLPILSEGSPWSLSGGWRTLVQPRRSASVSRLVLTSRLNFQPEHRASTLLSANGFHAVEHP